LAVAGKLITNGLQVREGTIQSGLEALNVAGDANGVSDGEVWTGGDGGSTADGATLDLLSSACDSTGFSRIGLDGRVKVLEVRGDLGEDLVDGVCATCSESGASKGEGESCCVSHFDV